MALKFRRGTNSGRTAITPAEGEPLFTTDTKLLYIGDGTTAGGVVVGGGVSDGDKGDVTVSASGATWTIDNDAVTYAKMQNVSAASKLLGRGDSGSGDTQEITLGTGLTMTGTTLSASGGGGSTSQTAFKAADQTTNTTSGDYSNDTNLSITVAVSGWYSIEIFVATTTADNGTYFGITGVGGWAKLSNSTTANVGDLANITVGNITFGTNFSKINGMVNCSGGENIRLAYYRIGGGNVTCRAGSYMKIEKAN